MSKKIILSGLFFFSLLIANAQNFVQVSVGASYTSDAYYRFSDDKVVNLDNDAWDLAFAIGAQDIGIHYNEGAKTSHTGAVPVLKFYLAPTNDFADVIDPANLTDSLYNQKTSWEDGAFNTVKDLMNPFDFGWGVYNPASHVIEGKRVYALKLRNDNWVKIKIESLDQGVYTMKYADLDGANEKTVTIDKADFDNTALALFSFETATATASPANWDLLFTRYTTTLDAGGGQTINYTVTGVLSAKGVEVAKVTDVDVASVNYESYLDSMDTKLDVIGHDWKFFDRDALTWTIDQRRVYFVKLADNHLWKLNFVDFEGSSSGNIVFEKTDLGQLTAVKNIESNFSEFGVFPNPVETDFTLSFSLKERTENMPVQLVNSLGQQVWETTIDAQRGLNVINFQKPKLPTGIYRLVTGQGVDISTSTLMLK